MNFAFISGIPASGKSYLANKVSKEIGIEYISIDNWREDMRSDSELKKWVEFFRNQNEEKYWHNTNCEQQWQNLKMQSEAIWPSILARINDIKNSGKATIFEGVNILPHLAAQDLDFGGIVLLGESFEQNLERNKLDPRWGDTEELQIQESEAFWKCERPRYEKEATRYGFKSFSNPDLAEKELLRLLQS